MCTIIFYNLFQVTAKENVPVGLLTPGQEIHNAPLQPSIPAEYQDRPTTPSESMISENVGKQAVSFK